MSHIWGPTDRLFKCEVKLYGMQKVHSCFLKEFFFITDTWEDFWISFLTVTFNQILLVNFFACWRILAWDTVVGALVCFPTEPPVFSKAAPSTCLRESIEVACLRESVKVAWRVNIEVSCPWDSIEVSCLRESIEVGCLRVNIEVAGLRENIYLACLREVHKWLPEEKYRSGLSEVKYESGISEAYLFKRKCRSKMF